MLFRFFSEQGLSLQALVKKVIFALMDNPPSIVVFVGDVSFIEPLCTEVKSYLPEIFTSPIHFEPIENSTSYLRGHNYAVSFYHDSCFRVISPNEFLDTHYHWLYKQVRILHEKHPELLTLDDAFQEVCLRYLDKILSKYENQCNLRTFVANRLRRYYDYIVTEQIKNRIGEIEGLLHRMEEL